MTIGLLPPDFDGQVARAVRLFWQTRGKAGAGRSQGGSRDAVISGKNMDGFIELVSSVGTHCGLPGSCIYTGGRRAILPGYFRATKNWDVLVIHHRRLLAAFELKSQVGSFGNNFNNRSEEVIGAAADLWAAHREGAYLPANASRTGDPTVSEPVDPLLNPELQSDPRPPFLAWLMLLEDCPKSRTPVGVDEPHYKAFPELTGASYAERYRILCERLMTRRLYSAAALILSEQAAGTTTGHFTSLSQATSIRALFSAFAAKLVAELPEDGRYGAE